MPFSCHAVITAEQIREQPLYFDAWIDDAWNRLVDAGTAFAYAYDLRGRCTLRLTGPGLLTTPPNLVHGDQILPGTIVAHFVANGEDIPYGRPDCTLDYDACDTG